MSYSNMLTILIWLCLTLLTSPCVTIDEFKAIQDWATVNALIINMNKTKELVFHRPHPRKFDLAPHTEGTERVNTAKLLGVIFQGNFCFNSHVDIILKSCSQRIYLLRSRPRFTAT